MCRMTVGFCVLILCSIFFLFVFQLTVSGYIIRYIIISMANRLKFAFMF